MSHTESKLRLMLAAPQLAGAIELFLPLARREYDELRAVAMLSSDTAAHDSADQWLTAIMVAELALKEAGLPVSRPIFVETGTVVVERSADCILVDEFELRHESTPTLRLLQMPRRPQ